MLDDWKINTNLRTYLENTVQGITTGFGLGLCGTACGGIGGFVGDFANQYINKGKVDLSQSLISGLTTYATSGVFNVGGPDQQALIMSRITPLKDLLQEQQVM